MSLQLSILPEIEAAECARDTGIQKAIDHANAVSENWSDRAYIKLMQYLTETDEFMTEDFRAYCAVIDFDLPPSARAFGGIILRACRNGLITQVGFGKVKNIKAHCANAAIWKKVYLKQTA